MTRAPLVGISCDRRMLGKHPFDVAGEKYIVAVRDGAGALPLLIPALAPALNAGDIAARVDGLLFTGSPTNVSPSLYGGSDSRAGVLLDEARDAITLPLLKAGIAAGVPILCICRGFQELNVALGGTLHQHLQEQPGLSDHRESATAPLDEQYGPAHPIKIMPDGLLARIVGGASEARVNSLHEQGIARLADGMRIEAEAPDGAIEAVSVPGAKGFVLAVQWHPEWKFQESALSRAIFAAFGVAASAFAQARA